MSDDDSVRIERVLPGPIDEVWEHLTDPAKIAGWLGNDAGDLGEVSRCEPPNVVAYRWGEGEVSFELVPRGENVVLVFTHRRHARVLACASRRMAA
ncbi:MAG: hypothetical protein KF819_17385 [Labilithrix sp.]|nr:hypothetical protein [Labilithrix sp.]